MKIEAPQLRSFSGGLSVKLLGLGLDAFSRMFIFEIVRSVFKSPNNSGDGAFEVARNGSVCALGIRIVL